MHRQEQRHNRKGQISELATLDATTINENTEKKKKDVGQLTWNTYFRSWSLNASTPFDRNRFALFSRRNSPMNLLNMSTSRFPLRVSPIDPTYFIIMSHMAPQKTQHSNDARQHNTNGCLVFSGMHGFVWWFFFLSFASLRAHNPTDDFEAQGHD